MKKILIFLVGILFLQSGYCNNTLINSYRNQISNGLGDELSESVLNAFSGAMDLKAARELCLQVRKLWSSEEVQKIIKSTKDYSCVGVMQDLSFEIVMMSIGLSSYNLEKQNAIYATPQKPPVDLDDKKYAALECTQYRTSVSDSAFDGMVLNCSKEDDNVCAVNIPDGNDGYYSFCCHLNTDNYVKSVNLREIGFVKQPQTIDVCNSSETPVKLGTQGYEHSIPPESNINSAPVEYKSVTESETNAVVDEGAECAKEYRETQAKMICATERAAGMYARYRKDTFDYFDNTMVYCSDTDTRCVVNRSSKTGDGAYFAQCCNIPVKSCHKDDNGRLIPDKGSGVFVSPGRGLVSSKELGLDDFDADCM